MSKIKEITDIGDMSIGQLYLYQMYEGRLRRGFCTRLEEPNKVVFSTFDGGYTETVYLRKYNDTRFSSDEKIYTYNASIFMKFNKLIEQQKQERIDLLNGKSPVIVKSITKKKWYERFIRRRNAK